MSRIYEDYAYGGGLIAQNYWAETVEAGLDFSAYDRLEGRQRADFVIVGAGYTGLNAALSLLDAGADDFVSRKPSSFPLGRYRRSLLSLAYSYYAFQDR